MQNSAVCVNLNLEDQTAQDENALISNSRYSFDTAAEAKEKPFDFNGFIGPKQPKDPPSRCANLPLAENSHTLEVCADSPLAGN